MLQRFNFAIALATNKIKGTRADLAWLSKAGVDLTDSQAVAARLTNALLTSDMSQKTRQALAKIPATLCGPNVNIKGINYVAPTAAAKESAAIPPCFTELITLLIGSPEFQRR